MTFYWQDHQNLVVSLAWLVWGQEGVTPVGWKGSLQVKGCISHWHCKEQAHIKAVVWSLAASFLETYCLNEKQIMCLCSSRKGGFVQGLLLCLQWCWECCWKLHVQPAEKGEGQRSLSASHNPQFSSPQPPDKEIIHHIFLEREKSRSYINTNAQFVMYLNGISPSE